MAPYRDYYELRENLCLNNSLQRCSQGRADKAPLVPSSGEERIETICPREQLLEWDDNSSTRVMKPDGILVESNEPPLQDSWRLPNYYSKESLASNINSLYPATFAKKLLRKEKLENNRPSNSRDSSELSFISDSHASHDTSIGYQPPKDLTMNYPFNKDTSLGAIDKITSADFLNTTAEVSISSEDSNDDTIHQRLATLKSKSTKPVLAKPVTRNDNIRESKKILNPITTVTFVSTKPALSKTPPSKTMLSRRPNNSKSIAIRYISSKPVVTLDPPEEQPINSKSVTFLSMSQSIGKELK